MTQNESYRIGVGLTTAMSQKTIDSVLDGVDNSGARSVWIGEDIGRGHDIFVLAAAAVMRTRTARVGTAIVPVATHTIMDIAEAAASLHDLRPGSFVLGIGIGGMQDLRRLGIAVERPVTMLRDAIRNLRALWMGEEVSLEFVEDEPVVVSINRRTPVSIPIFLGVRGPQMLRLAGELADGVIISGSAQYIERAIRRVKEAARSAHRQARDVEIVVWIPVMTTKMPNGDALAKRIVATVIGDTPRSVLDMLDIDQECVSHLKEVVARGQPDAGAELVSLEMIEEFSITGTPGQVAERFSHLAQMGVNEFVFGPPFGHNWRETVRDILTHARNLPDEPTTATQ